MTKKYISPKMMVINKIFNKQVAQLVNFSRYLIHEDGYIYDLKKNRLKKTNGKGYKKVFLIDDFGTEHLMYVHHIIARCFIGEIPEGWDVNHIDEDKGNNSRSNLEIISHKANCNHGTRCLRISQSSTGVGKITRDFEVVIHDSGERVVCRGIAELNRKFTSQSKNSWNYRIANVPNFTLNWYDYEDKNYGKISVRCLGNRKEIA